jgi:hypothetical protein
MILFCQLQCVHRKQIYPVKQLGIHPGMMSKPGAEVTDGSDSLPAGQEL